MRLYYFDHFRGIAILFIVAGHSIRVWTDNTFPEMVISNLITGGTAFFVFISGFFFHYIFYSKFQYNDFIIKKLKNVLLPYLLLSTIGFILIVICLDRPYHRFFPEPSSAYEYFIMLLQYFWTGRILTAYWFVPFIMIIFLLSLVFIRYIKLPIKKQLYILVLWILISMWVHRPGDNLSPIHSLLYFSPIYLLGIIFSIHKEKILEFINNKSIILGLLTILASVVQILICNESGNSYKEAMPLYDGINVKAMFSYNGIDIVIIQKILMIFFILSILQKEIFKNLKLLSYLASVSFAIYFIHPWVLFSLHYFSIIDYMYYLPGFIIFVFQFFFVTVISVVIAILFKYLLRDKSRYIIGW